MLQKTKGIVLNYIKYRESSIISHILTEKYGVQSFIVNGIRSARSKQRMISFQPLTILDLVIYYNPKKDINRISEFKLGYIYQTAHSHPQKMCMILFLSEIFHKILREEEINEDLFNFLNQSLVFFDQKKEGFQNFHLQLLLKLTRFLGFYPEDSFEHILTDRSEKDHFEKLLSSNYSLNLKLHNSIRRSYLEHILAYYSDHSVEVKNLKSLPVLKEVLS